MDEGAVSDRSDFQGAFCAAFNTSFRRVHRYLLRMSGDAELSSDLTQEAFTRLYLRGSLPRSPGAWVVSVAMNLLRNRRSTEKRRAEILDRAEFPDVLAEPRTDVEEGAAVAARVRAALQTLPARQRDLLLLQADGWSYREIAATLKLNERSIGVFVLRARRAFLDAYREGCDASR